MKVKSLLADRGHLNRLLGDQEEYSQDDIKKACELALDEINEKPPMVTNYTISDCPKYLLTLATAKVLIFSMISVKSRNSMEVNDGGALLNREGNLPLYQALYQTLAQEFNEQLQHHKIQANIMAGEWHV
jgi:hypothetical protein